MHKLAKVVVADFKRLIERATFFIQVINRFVTPKDKIMSCSIQYIVKLSAMLPFLLGVTIFNPAKASALDVSQIPLLGLVLQRGLSLEPSLKLLDQDMNRNNIQVCVLSCSPMPNAAIPTPVAPQLNRSLPGSGVGMTGGVLPEQVMQLPNQLLQQGMRLCCKKR